MITDIQLFFVLTAVIAVVCVYVIWFKMTYERFDAIMSTIIIMPMISFILGMVSMVGIQFLDGKTSTYYKPTCRIMSIRNTGVVSGDFTLGRGTIQETEYYFYFFKTIDNGFARGKKSVNNTTIVESNTSVPHIEMLKTRYESKTGWIKYHDQAEEKYRIVVPKGTILNKFELY